MKRFFLSLAVLAIVALANSAEAGKLLRKGGAGCCTEEPACCAPEPSCGAPTDCCSNDCCRPSLFERIRARLASCHHRNSCCEPSCEASCAAEPACCAPPTCAAEPACCAPAADCCDPCGRRPRLLDRLLSRHRGCKQDCCSEPSCCAAEPSCCAN